MKLIHEKEIDGIEGKEIVEVKEVSKISDVKKVAGTKNYVHKCYHDDAIVRPCERVEI